MKKIQSLFPAITIFFPAGLFNVFLVLDNMFDFLFVKTLIITPLENKIKAIFEIP